MLLGLLMTCNKGVTLKGVPLSALMLEFRIRKNQRLGWLALESNSKCIKTHSGIMLKLGLGTKKMRWMKQNCIGKV